MAKVFGSAFLRSDVSIQSFGVIFTTSRITKGNHMKTIRRYQSQLLFHQSYKPNRILRIKPAGKLSFSFRPVRFGMKPRIVNTMPSADGFSP